MYIQKHIVINNFIELSILCLKLREILNYFFEIKTFFVIIN